MNATAKALLIGASVVLVVIAWVWRNGGFVPQKRAPRRPAAVLPSPITTASVDFHHYPGEPAGYAGFTDYHAMLQTITDDLVDRESDWQFKTVGFAAGFLRAVRARIGASENAQHIFRVAAATAAATADDAEAIRWMALMQKEGTDNASPSTSNLKSMVQRVASDMSTAGPCRVKYWSKAAEDQDQDLAEAGISSERLLEFRRLMQIAEQRGELLGANAQMMPVEFSSG